MLCKLTHLDPIQTYLHSQTLIQIKEHTLIRALAQMRHTSKHTNTKPNSRSGYKESQSSVGPRPGPQDTRPTVQTHRARRTKLMNIFAALRTESPTSRDRPTPTRGIGRKATNKMILQNLPIKPTRGEEHKTRLKRSLC